jgi:hypothetical protein
MKRFATAYPLLAEPIDPVSETWFFAPSIFYELNGIATAGLSFP